jgi:hypothetical protein
MAAAWTIAMIVLLWYCVQESRKSNPNWARAIVAAMFWPITPFLRRYRSGKQKAEDT